MKYKLYTTLKVKEVEPNVCHSAICRYSQRRSCDKYKSCCMHIPSGYLTKISGVKDYRVGDKNWEAKHEKRHKAERELKKQLYKKCKPVYFEITKGR